MLSDLIAQFTTPVSPAHRALGYLNEALDLRRRARINRQAWQPHLDRTRAFVLSAAERCRDRNRVVILGSGLLLDLPLPELSRMFKEVQLQDVVCLRETRNHIRQYPNASFVERDATGVAEALYRGHGAALRALPEVPKPEPPGNADLVVSLNILSQLWVVPRAYVGGNMRQLAPEEADEWCAAIVASQYAFLRSLPCAVCLVADVEAIKRDSTYAVVSKLSTVYGLELPRPEQQWTWNIAPPGRTNAHHSKELAVGAWFFNSEPDSPQRPPRAEL